MHMTAELTILGWTLVLALVQVLVAANLRTMETGLQYNMGARDKEAPPPKPLTARMQRAQANLFETLPLFAAAVLIAHVAGREGPATLLGCQMYLIARIVYVPLYALGIPLVRSLVWVVSVVGLVKLFVVILA